jgi:hypothetical protein
MHPILALVQSSIERQPRQWPPKRLFGCRVGAGRELKRTRQSHRGDHFVLYGQYTRDRNLVRRRRREKS